MSDTRLTHRELRKIKGYENVSDEEADLIIDDAVAMARMILDCVERD